MREHVETVTIRDCVVQTFSAGGPGGQNQNRRSTAVRVIHPPSGARGESREHREQLQNKRAAFRRMAESDEFQRWARRHDVPSPETRDSQRVRTYNLIERRVVDHRTGHRTGQIARVLDGDIDLVYA